MTVAYTGYQVAELVGVPYRSLMRWVEAGLLNPEGARRGHRNPATWHDKDLHEASVLAACRLIGFSMQKMRKVMTYLKSVGQNPLSSGEFVCLYTGDGEPAELIKFCESGEVLALVRKPGQVVLPLWTPDR